MDNTCIYCGDVIPEGKMVCPICEEKGMTHTEKEFQMNQNEIRQMSLEQRVDVFMNLQQTIADGLGLAGGLQHGENMKMFDIWNKEYFEIKLNKYTEVKKEKGNKIKYIDHRSEE